MVAPINYSQYLPQINIAEQYGQGFQIGNAIQNAPLERERYALQNQAIQDELRQREALQQKKQQYESDLKSYWDNPTVQGAALLSTQYPEHAQAIKQAYDMQDEKTKEIELRASVPIYTALLNGKNDIALDLLDNQIEATRNSNKDTSGLEAYKSMIENDPKGAIAFGGTYLSTIQGADKFAKTFGDLQSVQNAPLAAQKIQSEISLNQAKTLGEFEDREIKREENAIKVMEADYKRADSDLKKQELRLRIDERQEKLDEKRRSMELQANEAASQVQGAKDTAQNTIQTIDTLLANKSLNDVVGTIEGRLPSVLSDEAADAIAAIDTIKSQAFLSAIPQMTGKGALSDAEGKKLESSIASLSRVQSESAFKANLKVIRDLAIKGQKSIEKKYSTQLGGQKQKQSGASGSFGTPAGAPMKPAGIPQAEWDQFIAETGGK